MKKFDLEAAKNGAPVVDREGNDVRILCFDRAEDFENTSRIACIKIEWDE